MNLDTQIGKMALFGAIRPKVFSMYLELELTNFKILKRERCRNALEKISKYKVLFITLYNFDRANFFLKKGEKGQKMLFWP